MKLDHINLTVSNVLETGGFLKEYFGYADAFEDNNAGMAVLRDAEGSHINLMKGSNATYPKYFHIGFDPGSEANVNAIYERLTNTGLKIDPPEHAWGSWTFHFKCPGAEFTIEVACASA
jgi:lactoylglutathione lyase